MSRVCSLSAVTLPNCRVAAEPRLLRREARALLFFLAHREVERQLVLDLTGLAAPAREAQRAGARR